MINLKSPKKNLNENIKIYRAGSQDGFSWTLKKETALEFQQRYNNSYNPIYFSLDHKTVNIVDKKVKYDDKEAIIQLFKSDSSELKDIIRDDYFKIISKEMNERELFNYSPFKRLISLELSSKKKDDILSKGDTLYNEIKNKFRPGHADFTYQKKYGIRDYRGAGRSSARETVARVAAGAIAKKYLSKINKILGRDFFRKKIKGKKSFYDFPNPHLNTSNFLIKAMPSCDMCILLSRFSSGNFTIVHHNFFKFIYIPL